MLSSKGQNRTFPNIFLVYWLRNDMSFFKKHKCEKCGKMHRAKHLIEGKDFCEECFNKNLKKLKEIYKKEEKKQNEEWDKKKKGLKYSIEAVHDIANKKTNRNWKFISRIYSNESLSKKGRLEEINDMATSIIVNNWERIKGLKKGSVIERYELKRYKDIMPEEEFRKHKKIKEKGKFLNILIEVIKD